MATACQPYGQHGAVRMAAEAPTCNPPAGMLAQVLREDVEAAQSEATLADERCAGKGRAWHAPRGPSRGRGGVHMPSAACMCHRQGVQAPADLALPRGTLGRPRGCPSAVGARCWRSRRPRPRGSGTSSLRAWRLRQVGGKHGPDERAPLLPTAGVSGLPCARASLVQPGGALQSLPAPRNTRVRTPARTPLWRRGARGGVAAADRDGAWGRGAAPGLPAGAAVRSAAHGPPCGQAAGRACLRPRVCHGARWRSEERPRIAASGAHAGPAPSLSDRFGHLGRPWHWMVPPRKPPPHAPAARMRDSETLAIAGAELASAQQQVAVLEAEVAELHREQRGEANRLLVVQVGRPWPACTRGPVALALAACAARSSVGMTCRGWCQGAAGAPASPLGRHTQAPGHILCAHCRRIQSARGARRTWRSQAWTRRAPRPRRRGPRWSRPRRGRAAQRMRSAAHRRAQGGDGRGQGAVGVAVRTVRSPARPSARRGVVTLLPRAHSAEAASKRAVRLNVRFNGVRGHLLTACITCAARTNPPARQARHVAALAALERARIMADAKVGGSIARCKATGAHRVHIAGCMGGQACVAC